MNTAMFASAPRHIATRRIYRHMSRPGVTCRNLPQHPVAGSRGLWRKHRRRLDMFALRTCGMWQNAPGDVSHSAISISAGDRTVAKKSKGLRDRNSPSCTLSQNGYGADRWFHVASVVTTQLRCPVPWRGTADERRNGLQSGAEREMRPTPRRGNCGVERSPRNWGSGLRLSAQPRFGRDLGQVGIVAAPCTRPRVCFNLRLHASVALLPHIRPRG